jgi:hypothetical protein
MPTAVRRILIALVVLVLLLIAADRVGVYIAEKAAADNLKKSQHLDSTPNVDIAGFPFLTQLASRDFDEITVTAKDVPAGQGTTALPISNLRVVLHGLTVSSGFSTFHARRGDATAVVSYADLGRALKSTVTYVGNGRVRAELSVSVLGQNVSGSITAKPELHGRSLGFGSSQLDGATGAVERAAEALKQVFGVDLPIARIPFDVRITSLEATPQGIELKLTGTDLTYTKS